MFTALALSVLALAPAAAADAPKTETLRFYSKDVSMKGPEGQPKPGDVLEVNSLDYRGNHRKHARRPSASHYLRCQFTGAEEPDCVSYVAIGGSLLVFEGYPGTVINGTGRYQGATGRVLKNKEVKGGGSDVVAKITLRAKQPRASSEPPWERALRVRGEAMNALLGD